MQNSHSDATVAARVHIDNNAAVGKRVLPQERRADHVQTECITL